MEAQMQNAFKIKKGSLQLKISLQIKKDLKKSLVIKYPKSEIMDYGKREAGGPIWILYSHNPLISDLGYFVTRDFFKSFLVCKDLFICKDLFLILTARVVSREVHNELYPYT